MLDSVKYPRLKNADKNNLLLQVFAFFVMQQGYCLFEAGLYTNNLNLSKFKVLAMRENCRFHNNGIYTYLCIPAR